MPPRRRARRGSWGVDPDTLLHAVDLAKAWIGTDDVRRAVVTHHRTGGRSVTTLPPGESLAELASLDDHWDDPDALAHWLRTHLAGIQPGARGGADGHHHHHPLVVLLPLRWHDHYTALVVTVPPAAALLFDPHAGRLPRDRPRWYAPPPVDDVLRPVLRAVGVPTWGVAVGPDDGPASQREPADTLCVAWMTMYLGGCWRPGLGLGHAFRFLQRCVRDFGCDFGAYGRGEHGLPAARVRAMHRALTRATVAEYRRAFHLPA